VTVQRTGKRMPIDVESRADGNIVKIDTLYTPGAPPTARVEYVRADVDPTLDRRQRFVSHFATCPDAAQHRKAKR
jgi:hypothetical protein